MSVKQTALKLAALVLAFAGIAAPAFAQTKNNPTLKVQWPASDTAGVISEFRIDPIAHHLMAYVTPDAAEPDPSPQAPGNWRTVAGLDGLTRVALKVSANGTLATGADPGGPVQGCSDCIVIGGLSGLTPTALKVGADGTVATSGGSAIVQTASVTLTSAQVLALTTTPVTIIPAVGSGFTIVPLHVGLRYKFVSAAYVIGTASLTVDYANGTTLNGLSAINSGAGIMDQVVSKNRMFAGTATSGILTSSTADNQDLQIKNAGSAYTTGDGTLTVVIDYMIVASNL